MKTLCMDTSHRYLVLALLEDNKEQASYVTYAWKKQSEIIFVELIRLMETIGWSSDDIDEVVITVGPGSYTGIRIAMTIAKVFCATKHKTLYTISTLQLYAGKQTCTVILDARSNRVYYGKYENGTCFQEMIMNVNELIHSNDNFVGDVSVLGKEDIVPDFVGNFIALRENYIKVDNIHAVVPEYLKSEQEYI